MNQDGEIVVRTWNDTPIGRRPEDGYVNATAMCKANGKEWKHFRENENTTHYLQALSGSVGIPTDVLVQSTTTGRNEDRGTWVHPDVATELARWISPAFSVFVNQWFRGEVERRSQAQPSPQPRAQALGPGETLEVLERGYNMLERLGVADDRDRLQFGDMIRNTTARAAGGYLLPANPDDEELTVSDAWLEVTGSPLPRKKASEVGKIIANLYRKEHGEQPPTRTQQVDGAPRKVNSYRRGFLARAIKTVVSRLAS